MRLALSALVVAATLALPAVAHADAMDAFTVTGHGLDLTFSLPSSPVVGDGYEQGLSFFLGDIAFTENGVMQTASDVYFYTRAAEGGFELDDEYGDPIDGLDFTGPKLFTGGVRRPTFKEGTFRLTQVGCEECEAAAEGSEASLAPCAYRLRIDPVTTAATPEPGSLALLGTGALGAIGVVRRRFQV